MLEASARVPDAALGARVRARSALPALQARRAGGGALVIICPPGTYRGMLAWRSRSSWLAIALERIYSSCARATLRGLHVAADTVAAVARADAAAADGSSGRNVATSNQSVGRRIGRSYRTVQRARAALVALDLSITVHKGRYLTVRERAKTRGRQIRAASTRALIHPQHPRPTHPQNRLDRRRGVLPRRGHLRVNSRSPMKAKRAVENDPQPIELQRLAAGLVALVPSLGRDRHIGSLVRALGRYGIRSDIDPRELVGLYQASGPPPAEILDPVAYFAWQLRLAPSRLKIPAGPPLADRLASAGLPPRRGECDHHDPFGHGWCVRCGDPMPATLSHVLGRDLGQPREEDAGCLAPTSAPRP